MAQPSRIKVMSLGSTVVEFDLNHLSTSIYTLQDAVTAILSTKPRVFPES